MIGMSRRGYHPKSEQFDEAAFTAWLETGSLMQAGLKLRKEGKVKQTGEPYSMAGVRFAALRHYIRKYPETRVQVEATYKLRGFLTAAENLDISTINYVFTQLRREKDAVEWLKTQGLYEMYEDYILEKIKKQKQEYDRLHFVE